VILRAPIAWLLFRLAGIRAAHADEATPLGLLQRTLRRRPYLYLSHDNLSRIAHCVVKPAPAEAVNSLASAE